MGRLFLRVPHRLAQRTGTASVWYRIEYIYTSPAVILDTNALRLSQVQNVSRNPSLSTLVVLSVSPSGTPAGVGGDQLMLVVSRARFSRR